MAVMYEDGLKKELSAGNLAGGYLLFGDDAYLKQYYAERISRRACGGDPFFNLQCFEDGCDLQEVYDAVLQYPIMADRKCVILTDYDFEDSTRAKETDRLCGILRELNDTCVLILRFESVAFDIKRSAKAKKILAALEKGGGRAVRLDHRQPKKLAEMLIDGAAKRGCRFDGSAARYLVEVAGTDLQVLRSELDKLCNYAPGGTISREIVDLVCTKTVEASVYHLTEKILACDPAGALEVLDSLFYMRLEPMIILHTVSSAYVDLYRMAAAGKAGVRIAQAAADFGYKKGREFVLERAARQLKRVEPRHITLSFEALLAADRALKSFNGEPRTVLEQLVVRLCYILAKGKSA